MDCCITNRFSDVLQQPASYSTASLDAQLPLGSLYRNGIDSGGGVVHCTIINNRNDKW